MQDFIQYRHVIPGRIRLRIPLAKQERRILLAIKTEIDKIEDIRQCSVNPSTGSVLIYYNSQQCQYPRVRKQINKTIIHIIKESWADLDSLRKMTLDEAAAQLQIPRLSSQAQKLWYELAAEEALEILASDPHYGLSIPESQNRLKIFGTNDLLESPRPTLLSLFLGQFNMMTRLLLGACGISLMLGQIADAVSILVIVGMESLLGMEQEKRAEESLVSLKRLTAPEAIVIREGRRIRVAARELVPGDIIQLEAGNLVPADCRLINCNTLEIKEDTLTGESQSISKQCLPRRTQSLSLAEQDNMAFMGTYVTRGRALAVVAETGKDTQIGRIAMLLDELSIENTPLQKQMDGLGQSLSLLCLGVCAGISVFGILRGQGIFNMLRTGVSLAVGAIPEGLPVFVTISMAFGVQRMAGKNAVVRRLPVVETLAYATVICSDKTGTLTSNEMTVTELYTDDRTIIVTGKGYHPSGLFIESEGSIHADQDDHLLKLMFIGALCNNAHLQYNTQEKNWQVLGDPTEAALLVLAKRAGIDQARLEQMMQREMEVPFDSETRLMGVVLRNEEGERVLFVKGAPEQVLKHCSLEYREQEERKLGIRRRTKILATGDDMAARALRVIGTAYKVVRDDSPDPALLFSDLVFVGLAGMMDPPRPEVKNAVEKCRQAGIKTVMITGDQQQTAVAIARELDMLGQGRQVSGNQIDAMSDEELDASIQAIELIYRASPIQKLRIVRAFKKQGLVVVMTGDGVNDAPAVKEAHVGISMGCGGTDVTREASGITLTDDSFATIVTAVEEGRTIRANIRKFMRYVLAGNLGEIIAVAGCSMLGLPIPLDPGHILWVNLATEGIPALALGMDPPDPACMHMPAEKPDQKILDKSITKHVLTRGGAIGATTMGMMAYGLVTGPGNLGRSRTMALCNLISCQMFNVFDSRCLKTEDHKSMPGNPYLLPSVLASSGLLLGIVYFPWLQGIFSTYPIGLRDWFTILISSGIISRLDRFTGFEHLQNPKLPELGNDSIIPIDINKSYPSSPCQKDAESLLRASNLTY